MGKRIKTDNTKAFELFDRLKESHAELLKTLTIKFLQGTNFNNTPVVRQIRQAEKLQKELA